MDQPESNKSDIAYWTNRHLLATTLFCLAADRYPEFLGTKEDPDGWTPEALSMQIADECGLPPPKVNLDKVFAARAIVQTDRFQREPRIFVDLCNVLGGTEHDPTVFDPADALECAWGVTEAMVLDPFDEPDEAYSPEVLGYIEHSLMDDGIYKAPGILRDIGVKDPGYTDDPEEQVEVRASASSIQQEKSNALERAVGARLAALRDQLKNLKLRNGSTDRYVEILTKFLNRFGL